MWLVFWRQLSIGGAAVFVSERFTVVPSDTLVAEMVLAYSCDGAWLFDQEPTVDAIERSFASGGGIGSLPGAARLYVRPPPVN